MTTLSSSFPKSMPLSKDIWRCEQHMSQSQFFRPITQESFADFSAQLAIKSDPDSYLTSPTYYAYTGRNGLWVYHGQDSFIPVCWHPNIPGQLLVFLPEGKIHQEILSKILNELPHPPKGVRLARIKSDPTRNMGPIYKAELPRSYTYVPVIEHVLDWKYPVRILSTEKVAAMDGADFRYIRNHVKQITSKKARIESISANHIQSLRHFVRSWAQHMVAGNDGIQSYLSPYDKMLHLMESGTLKADGFLVLIDGEIQSFTLWDTSNTGSNQTANRFVNLCNVKYRGLAEFNTVHMSEMLFAQGIQYVNIGGAETASLDGFKTKFMPVRSIPLCSVDVIEHDADLQYDDAVISTPSSRIAHVQG